MVELVCTDEALTDSEMPEYLNTLPLKRELQYVSFSKNELKSVPDLTQHKQLECVEEVNLSHKKW